MRTDPDKEKKWRILLKEFKAANLTIDKFCKLHDLKFHQFTYWQNKIESKKTTTIMKKPSFIKVLDVAKETENDSELSIEVNQIKIKVPVDFNTIHLKKMIRFVQAID